MSKKPANPTSKRREVPASASVAKPRSLTWLWVAIPALAALVVIGSALWVSQRNAELAAQPIPGVNVVEGLEAGLHTSSEVEYPNSPAVGGQHDPVWLDCDGAVYSEPVRDENAVHALEHGAVWITYNDSATADDIETLTDLASGQPYTFISPYPTQTSPITLSAWGLQLDVDTADDDRIERFLERYRQGEQTPEPGATCTPVQGSPTP